VEALMREEGKMMFLRDYERKSNASTEIERNYY
jgi:hypothetical protein